MTLKIYDSMSKQKKEFIPFDKENIGIYVCGPTVYDLAHIGNARPIIVFDVLFRILRKIYGNEKIKYVRNITDIDDKIINTAKKKNISVTKLTTQTIEYFHEDISFLNVLKPTFEPKATETLEQMIDMISDLIKKGFAYEAEKHVLFNTNTFKEYGKLSKRSTEDMIAGSRVEVAPYKKNPYDFILWKPSRENEPGWDSPWGFGRPGWHIECSAMTKKYLGKSFDIHAGGADLLFPHHENEIAQSESSHNEIFAKYWMHNGYLNIEGEKMSKSIGNILTIRELLNDYDGEVLKFAMLSSHYRQPINFSKKLLNDSLKQLKKIYTSLSTRSIDNKNFDQLNVPNSLLDDMNTPMAISEIHELVKKLNDTKISDEEWIKNKNLLIFYGELLGLFSKKSNELLIGNQKKLTDSERLEIEKLIKDRNIARQSNNFELADKLREKLHKKGVILEDKGAESIWKIRND